jgi:hypothetical protein
MNVPVGDKISACIAWAACAICSDRDGPGNDSRRRPANHGEVESRGAKAVSLNGKPVTVSVQRIGSTFTHSSIRAEVTSLSSKVFS